MDDKFLQDFLRTGLFDIGDSDERLKWLQDSIGELNNKLNENKSLLPSYILASLDPNISDTEPVMVEVESIITKYWKALRAKYSEMPRNIIRGVILNSLNNVGKADPHSARIISLAGSNFYPYAKLNTEKTIVAEMLSSLAEIAEANAVEEWALIDEDHSLKIGALKITDFKFTAVELDKEQLKTGLLAAVQNDPTHGHGPQHGGNSQWGPHFAAKSSEAISKSFKAAVDELIKSLSPTAIEGPINKFFAEFKKSLDVNLKNSFASLKAVERRGKLLWWKEALYSTSQKRGYRDLNPSCLPVIMSFDLNNQIPEITPISVDYLLRDTLFMLLNKQDAPVKFSDYLAQISNPALKPILKPCLGDLMEKEGRISVTEFLGLFANGRVEMDQFKSRTGIDENETITLGDLSVTILHDLLTQRLIAE
jgi:hypothetical protein